ncbi:MAG: peptidase S10 [Castellaniella sp.]|uniref:S10 family peptidase n=1 Tax=Castellaniella sp. TaxID=1955812 RepID=UPI003C739332
MMTQLKTRCAIGLAALALVPAAAWSAVPDGIEQTTALQDQVTVGAAQLDYTVTAGKLLLRTDEGKPSAALSYTAYTLDGAQAAWRPVTFFWDGGPGGSTFAENFFGFGPKRYFASRHGHAGPPYLTQANPYTLLAHSDLVFIDPVGTGYSHALGQFADRDFWGVEPDADAMSAAIIRYLRMNRRWQSPKFLLGSSYGTTRASIVADKLQSNGMAINGVILVGSALNFGMQDNGLDQQFTLGLPSMAAIAWHHGKTAHQSMALPDFLRAVEAFVRTEYGPALSLGNRLPSEQKQALAKKLAGYIGLDAQYIHDAHLRVSVVRFRKELLRDQGLTVGRLDGRSVSADFDTVGEEPENDYWLMEELLMPARGVIESFYGAELGRDDPQDYRIVAAGAIQAWTWDHELPNIAGISRYELQERNIFPQNTWVAAHLSAAMRANRNLRVFQAHGYFDLATPYAWGDYDLSHMTHDQGLMDRITTSYYEAGHTIFFDEKAIPRMSRELGEFYAAALKPHAGP